MDQPEIMIPTLSDRLLRAHLAGDGSKIGIVLGLSIALLGCASQGAAPLPAPVPSRPLPPRSLQVRLIFGEEADLDLFVTDPDLETVYFGNNPSLGGGVLAEDVRCDRAAPRGEVVTFLDARSGRYRVGIEHARSCTRLRRTVPYRVEVLTGGSTWQVEGEIAPAAFDNRVVEFDLYGSVATPASSRKREATP